MRAFVLTLFFTLSVALPAQAAGFDALYELVPSRADGIAAVDHQQMVRHKAAAKLRMFIHDQGGARGLQAVVALGLVPGKDIHRSVSFNVGTGEVDLISGAFDLAAVEKRAKAKLGAKFAAGELRGRRWFTVDRRRRCLALGKGLVAVGTEKMVTRALDRADGKGKSVTRRTGFKAMLAPATKAKAAAWGMTWVPKAIRKRLTADGAADIAAVTRARFHVVGDGAMTVHGTGYVGSPEEAAAFKAAVEGKIARALKGSMMLKVLGVAGLAKGLTLVARGKTVVAKLPMTPAQVDLVATTGGKAIAILKGSSR